jgi:hypothetical protein
MNHTCLIPLLLVGLSFAALPAQDTANYPPPTPPLVAPVPDNAAWILSISDGKEQSLKPATTSGPSQAGSANAGLKQISVTKTGKLKRDIVAYGNGTTVELWYADGVLVTTDSKRQPTVLDYKVADARFGNGLGSATKSAGFTGLNWLDLKYYDHVVMYQGQPCYHYGITTKQAQPLSAPPGTASQTIGAEAWINVKTGLPVAYTTGDGKLYTYRFLDSPTTPLTLPPDYQVTLAVFEKDRDERKRLDEAAAALRRP